MMARGVMNGMPLAQPPAQLTHQRSGVLKLSLVLQPLGHNCLRYLCHRQLPRLRDHGQLFVLLRRQFQFN